MTAKTTDVSTFIDEAPFRGLLRLVPALCCLLMVLEGVDNYSVGYVGPFLSKAYGIGPKALGVVYTSGIFASLLGATVLAPLSDRLGRKTILAGTSLVIGICTILTPLADHFLFLFAVRFLIGLAFGAAVPTTFSLAADYAPARLKAVLIMTVSSGVAVGIILAGLAAAAIIPAFGWRALMVSTGAMSLACTPLLFWLLPESARFLLVRRGGSQAAERVVRKLLGTTAFDEGRRLVAVADVADKRPMLELVSHGRAILTFILWFALSATYAVVFFLSYWLPTLLMAGGASVKSTGLIIAAAKSASVVGAVVIGRLMDRFGRTNALVVTFGLAAAVVAILGQVSHAAFAIVFVILTCFLVDGSFGGVQALAASSYPPSMRASASGWITGWARFLGGGSGTMAGGFLVASHWPVDRAAILLAIPLLLGAGALFWLTHLNGRLDRFGALSPRVEGAAAMEVV